MLSFQNWTNMTFAILSACITFVEFIINCFLSGDKRGSARMAIFIPMLVLSLAQSGIALAVAIYCCKYWCSSSCCYQTPREVSFFYTNDDFFTTFSFTEWRSSALGGTWIFPIQRWKFSWLTVDRRGHYLPQSILEENMGLTAISLSITSAQDITLIFDMSPK